MIELRDVQKHFGTVHAVRGVSLDVPAGQIVGILGPNGAGKTTTVRMIAGAIPPSSGSVRVSGLDSVRDTIEVRRAIGYLPESAPLYREMKVGDYLAHRAGLQGLRGTARRRAVDSAAEQCHLGEVMRRRTGQLSKGYRQRVGLASVLLHDPKLLILDEPTSGLDPEQIAETRGLIRALAGRRTMLLVSHILPEVERVCDRILLFARGRVQADGPPGTLMGELPGAGRYTVEASSAGSLGASAEMVFGALPGVESVEATPLNESWTRYLIAFAPSAGDQRESIALAARSANLLIRELRPQATTLEDVYLRLMAYAENDPGLSSRAAPAAGAA
ncbi:MAG: ABC transporter ATP-binding protein [Planctomycetota bacterium]|nr:ABC transporter ATP-binding protein [Planctomycetota bacterium]